MWRYKMLVEFLVLSAIVKFSNSAKLGNVENSVESENDTSIETNHINDKIQFFMEGNTYKNYNFYYSTMNRNFKENMTKRHCSYDSNCEENEICNNILNLCECDDYMTYELGKCIPCPGLGSKCSKTGCCGDSQLGCFNQVCLCDDGTMNCESAQPPFFITASQIALATALIMGIAALIMVIYRLCTKPHYLSARHRAAAQRSSNMDSGGRTSFLRASLTSIQIRVLSRLRDRPPAYDNHNQTTTISGAVHAQEISAQPVDGLPPPYENHRNVDVNLPPPYSEVVTNPDGYSNPGYLETETSVTITRISDTEPKTSIETSSRKE